MNWKSLSIAMVFMIGCTLCLSCCTASQPDPYFRMESPKGCSGGWYHASPQYGLWGITCKHCVSRPGLVKVRLFWDGRISSTVTGWFVAAHPSADVSIFHVPYSAVNVLPKTIPLPGPGEGPFLGQAAFAVGSFYGRSKEPVIRKSYITYISSDGRSMRLQTGAWGGHSGGIVCISAGNSSSDFNDENLRFAGVLWGTRDGRPGTALVTGPTALWEVATWRMPPPAPQAFFSVPPEKTENAIVEEFAMNGTVDYYGKMPESMNRDIRESHLLSRHIYWRAQGGNGPLRIIWEDPNGKRWKIDGWSGTKDFIGRYRNTGMKLQCPIPGQWGPGFGGGQSPQQPQLPWPGIQFTPPVQPVAPAPPAPPEVQTWELLQEIKKLLTSDVKVEVNDGTVSVTVDGKAAQLESLHDSLEADAERIAQAREHVSAGEGHDDEVDVDGDGGVPSYFYAILAVIASMFGGVGIGRVTKK